jgi:RNA 3'-terminal phosphate cyclase (ATP)
MIEIDGSHGEGGGQIIRSSLALSAVTGKPFRVFNIRAGRNKPGLKRQHVTAVNAAREICGAGVSGAELQSSELIFAPGPIQTRDFHFKIGTAGSSTLVAQTVLPALMQAESSSSITIEGGTHNQGAPPYDFLERVYLPQVETLGPKFQTRIDTYGFYPVGGGKLRIDITPARQLGSLNLLSRKQKTRASVTALVSRLPLHIAQRELDIIRRKGNWQPGQCHAIEIKNSPGPGNVVMIEFDSGNVRELITGFGQRGVPAEVVARQAFRESRPYQDSTVPVGEHLADQLLLPMGLAAAHGQSSSYISGPLSLHSKTHIDVLKMFLEIEVRIEEIESDVFQITTNSLPS